MKDLCKKKMSPWKPVLSSQQVDSQNKVIESLELYDGNEKVSALLTQLSWSCHLLIMSGCKSDEEREFYIRLAIKERYTYRELERQMDSGYYERYMLSKDKLLPEKVKAELNPFLDSYVMEFLDLPTGFLEKDLRKGLIGILRCLSDLNIKVNKMAVAFINCRIYYERLSGKD